jgi:hypothetical protein
MRTSSQNKSLKGSAALGSVLLAALLLPGWMKQRAFASSMSPSGDLPSVVTQHNDNGRTGANLRETILNTSTVNSNAFGKLFSRLVDGCIYAQPLFVPGVPIPQKGAHNAIYVATEHDSVYAFDADDPAASDPLWLVSLGDSVPSSDISPDYQDLTPEIGITSTPVIDSNSGTIYVVAKSKDESGCHQKLHALDITTGFEKLGGPVEISASVEGSGDGSVGGIISFNPLLQLNRPGLLLSSGVVYIAFGSHGDTDPYHGWVLGYSATTLQQVAVYNTTPDGGRGAIWMSGQGLTGDSLGNLYVVTANGTCDAAANCGRNLGESFIKLTPALAPADWFTPLNRLDLDRDDLDVGSGGPVLLPGTSLIAAAGKDGVLRLVNTNGMGGFDPRANHDVQEFQATANAFLGAPIYWTGPDGHPAIYVWGGGDRLKAFTFADGKFAPEPVSESSMLAPTGLSNSAPLSLSANGSEAGSGIVWASCPEGGDANLHPVHGILRAFDASDLSVELWNTSADASRDDVGAFAKFCPPTVANGKVYVASFSGRLNVYGLRSSISQACSCSISPSIESFKKGGRPGSVEVQANRDCAWRAISSASWITITSGNTGTGSGTVQYVVDANDGAVARTGTITIAGETFTVEQRGRPSH